MDSIISLENVLKECAAIIYCGIFSLFVSLFVVFFHFSLFLIYRVVFHCERCFMLVLLMGLNS